MQLYSIIGFVMKGKFNTEFIKLLKSQMENMIYIIESNIML